MFRSGYRLDQSKTPFLDGLKQYSLDGIIPFHTPGHKQGRSLDKELRQALGELPFRLDVSDEISSPVHDNNSEAVLREAEALAADAFGADRTFFLHNGTTAGIQAMLLAVRQLAGHRLFRSRFSQEDVGEVILPRSVHRSVFGGLVLAGLTPRFVQETWDEEWNIPLPASISAWQTAAEAANQPVAFLETYPSYYGIAGNLGKVAQLAAEWSRPLLVDEAHGAHFGFHPGLPPTALSLGAAASAQSAHKVLGVLTQASLLHTSRQELSELMPAILGILQSTSPSFLLYASLDAGRRQMAVEGRRLWQQALELSQAARERINQIPGLQCLDREILTKPEIACWDPTRLLIRVDLLGLSGSQAEKWLRQEGIQVELAGLNHILVLVTIGDGPSEVGRLVEALGKLAQVHAGPVQYSPVRLPKPRVSGKIKLSPRRAMLSHWHAKELTRAIGEIAASSLTPYPPGIPALVPGEQITAESIEYLEECWQRGIEIRGWADVESKTIWVVDAD
ncbi:MAG: lysine decarboxylase [Firmicutes bacterium]|nr:lysine decarboxylase [Bacillota bacterium]